MAIGGFNPSGIITDIWSEIDYAAQGKAFSDATYGGTFGLRKAGHLSIKTRSRMDVLQRPVRDMYDVNVDLELYQNDLQTMYNCMLLAKQGPYNMRFKGADGNWFNFVDNGTLGTGSIINGSATGSVLLNHTFTFEVGAKERSLKLKANGGMFDAEYQWLASNSSTGATGGSSGAAITGLTHMKYDMSRVGAPGILDVKFGTDDVGFQEEGSKLTLDFKEMGKVHTRDWPILGWIDAKLELMMWQTDIAGALNALRGYTNTDQTITVTLAPAPNDTAPLTISFVNSLFVAPEFDAPETKRMQKVTLQGRIPIDNPGWAGTNANFNIGTNTLTLNRVGYVAV